MNLETDHVVDHVIHDHDLQSFHLHGLAQHVGIRLKGRQLYGRHLLVIELLCNIDNVQNVIDLL